MKNSKTTLAIIIVLAALLVLPSITLATDDTGEKVSVQHRSKVAEVVKQLSAVAKQARGIGDEISKIANEQNITGEEEATIMEKIEARGKLKNFLIGTDYKNIGALRSALATTTNHLERLKKALQKADTEELKTKLTAQITALEQAKTQVESFVKTNLSKFSLFGWLVKLFQ